MVGDFFLVHITSDDSWGWLHDLIRMDQSVEKTGCEINLELEEFLDDTPNGKNVQLQHPPPCLGARDMVGW